MSQDQDELTKKFLALPIQKQKEIGRWCGKIAQLKTRLQWNVAFSQVEPELLPFVRKMAKRVWEQQQEMERERNSMKEPG